MQKKFHFWYRLFGFTKDQGFLRNQTSCNSTNKQELKIDFLKLRIFAQALDILRKRKKPIYLKHFRQRIFLLDIFFVFSVT